MSPEDRQLAAEYVLGTLSAAAAEALQARLAQDADLAREVVSWEQSLSPLADLVAPVSPPDDLWARIEASVAAPLVRQPANDNRVVFWRAATAAGFAVAAGLLAFLTLRPIAEPSYAVIAPLNGAPPLLVAIREADGKILVRPSGGSIKIATDRDLELWALAAGAAKPIPLGVLPPAGMQVASVAPGTQLLVSVEPKGGSPTGVPTGPVVYGGVLVKSE